MNRTLLSLALSAAFVAAPAQAGPLEDRVELLTKQLVELQDQVSQLRSMLNRDGTGKVVLTSTSNRNDLVGTDFSTSVGGNVSSSFGRSLALAVGQSRTTQVGVNDLLTVTGSSTSNVGGNWSLNVSGSATQKATNNLSVAAARDLLVQAGDQITLKTGSASILMRKNGEITITGTTIQVLGSGDVVIKGSKVLSN